MKNYRLKLVEDAPAPFAPNGDGLTEIQSDTFAFREGVIEFHKDVQFQAGQPIQSTLVFATPIDNVICVFQI